MIRSPRKNPFSEAMDRKLIKLVKIYGTNNWNMISRSFPDKSANKCKARWKYYLSPANEPVPWSEEEDRLLLALESQIGTKWTVISQSFVRRTPGDVRGRFLKLKKQLKKTMKINCKLYNDAFVVVPKSEPKTKETKEQKPEKPKEKNPK